MCGSRGSGMPLSEVTITADDLTTTSSISRRPVGTRRRQLEWLTNFVLGKGFVLFTFLSAVCLHFLLLVVVVSLMGCSVGAGLIGFYQLHLLSFISYEFFIIPLVLLGKSAVCLHLCQQTTWVCLHISRRRSVHVDCVHGRPRRDLAEEPVAVEVLRVHVGVGLHRPVGGGGVLCQGDLYHPRGSQPQAGRTPDQALRPRLRGHQCLGQAAQ